MPELPEVEVHRRHLQAWVPRRVVEDVHLKPARLLPGTQPRGLLDMVRGARLGIPQRHGKHLWIPTNRNAALYVHLGMTGHLSRRKHAAPAPRFCVLSLVLSGGWTVDLTDPRRFSTLGLIPDDAQEHAPWAGLGVDLLHAPPTPKELVAALNTRKPIKVALMEQERIAGLGNIHAAEALWRARIPPTLPANTLTVVQARALLKGIQQTFALVLKDDDGKGVLYVEVAGNPNPFLIYGRGGAPCPRCGSPIAQFTQAGRTTYVCNRCQPAP